MTRLRVLFLTSWYPTANHPVSGIFVREHAKAVRRFDDVVVVHLAGIDPLLRRPWRIEREQEPELTQGIRTYRVWHRGLPKTGLLLRVISALVACRRVAREGFRPQIVHAHIFDAAFPAAVIGWLWRLPLLVSEHYTGFPRRLLSARDVRLTRFAFMRAFRVLPVSLVLQRAIESYGIPARFAVVPNVVDTDLFYPARRRGNPQVVKQLLFVGLMDPSPTKGIPILLEALCRLRLDSWVLHMVGDGPGRPCYERMAADLGLTQRVLFHGLLPKPCIASLMRRVDFLIVPSNFETFSVAAAEALATDLPVVATRCGGPEEFVTPDWGVLVPPGDVAALARALEEALMSDHARWRSSAGHVRKIFGPEAVGRRLHDIYCTAMDSKRFLR